MTNKSWINKVESDIKTLISQLIQNRLEGKENYEIGLTEENHNKALTVKQERHIDSFTDVHRLLVKVNDRLLEAKNVESVIEKRVEMRLAEKEEELSRKYHQKSRSAISQQLLAEEKEIEQLKIIDKYREIEKINHKFKSEISTYREEITQYKNHIQCLENHQKDLTDLNKKLSNELCDMQRELIKSNDLKIKYQSQFNGLCSILKTGQISSPSRGQPISTIGQPTSSIGQSLPTNSGEIPPTVNGQRNEVVKSNYVDILLEEGKKLRNFNLICRSENPHDDDDYSSILSSSLDSCYELHDGEIKYRNSEGIGLSDIREDIGHGDKGERSGDTCNMQENSDTSQVKHNGGINNTQDNGDVYNTHDNVNINNTQDNGDINNTQDNGDINTIQSSGAEYGDRIAFEESATPNVSTIKYKEWNFPYERFNSKSDIINKYGDDIEWLHQ